MAAYLLMWSGGKNQKHAFCQKKVESQFKENPELSSLKKQTNKQKNHTKEIYADVKTAQIESKQAIGYCRLALKSQVSSLEHN